MRHLYRWMSKLRAPRSNNFRLKPECFRLFWILPLWTGKWHHTSTHYICEEGYYSQCKWYFEIWTSLFTSLSQYDFGCSSQHILIIECETEILFNNAAFNGHVLNPIPPFSKSSNDSDIKTSSILIESFPYFWTHSNEKQYCSSFARIL